MPEAYTYGYVPDQQQGQPARSAPTGGAVGRLGVWFFMLAALLLLGLSGLATWRWVDANLLHWGMNDTHTTTVDHAALLERVRAFELATVKHTYAGHAEVAVSKALSAGPLRVALPGWAAGQQLDVRGNVTVTAGVDLGRVRPEDMEITRQGNETRVVVHVPAPQVLSAELAPGTLDMSTSEGVVTRMTKAIGLKEQDLRDRAADQVMLVARESAVREGILDDAARETAQRLQAFLQSIPRAGGHVTYVVEVQQPAIQ